MGDCPTPFSSMDLKALDISMSRCSLLDSCSAKLYNNNILHKMDFPLRKMDFPLRKMDIPLRKMVFTLSRKRRLLVALALDAQ